VGRIGHGLSSGPGRSLVRVRRQGCPG